MAIILLVEDDPMIQRLVKLRLETMGHQALVAQTGVEGVDLALKNSPDLVLMDMHMPQMNGMEAVSLLRDKHYPGMVVGFTASILPSEMHLAIEAGCNAVMTKPVTSDFERQISEHLLAAEQNLCKES